MVDRPAVWVLGGETWNFHQQFAIFCFFATSTGVKKLHGMSVITFNLSDNEVFFFVCSEVSNKGDN